MVGAMRVEEEDDDKKFLYLLGIIVFIDLHFIICDYRPLNNSAFVVEEIKMQLANFDSWAMFVLTYFAHQEKLGGHRLTVYVENLTRFAKDAVTQLIVQGCEHV